MRAYPGSEHTVSKSTIPLHNSLTPAVGIPGAVLPERQRAGGILLRGSPGDAPERGVEAAGASVGERVYFSLCRTQDAVVTSA